MIDELYKFTSDNVDVMGCNLANTSSKVGIDNLERILSQTKVRSGRNPTKTKTITNPSLYIS